MKKIPTSELLRNFSMILAELRRRGITRTENIPTGDLAEFLVCEAMNFDQEPNSSKGYDAVDSEGLRYQIKGRRITEWNPSLQLSAIRDLPDQPFDVLFAVLFDQQFQLTGAFSIPVSVCQNLARYIPRTNSYTLHANDSLIGHPEAVDHTADLQRIYNQAEQVAASDR